MITQKSARLGELGLLDECTPEILSAAKDDKTPHCHPERSEGSLADLRVITSPEEVSERTPMCYNTLTNRKELT